VEDDADSIDIGEIKKLFKSTSGRKQPSNSKKSEKKKKKRKR